MDEKTLKAELYDLHIEQAKIKAMIQDKLKELYLLKKEAKNETPLQEHD